MVSECFANVIAPACFALLSDKAKERSLALAQLKTSLPDAIARSEIDSETAAQVVKSFLDWVSFETRSCKKLDSSDNFSKLQSSLKELKWLLVSLSSRFPAIKITSVLSLLLDRLNELLQALNIPAFPEVFFILNQIVFCKTPYIEHVKHDHLTARYFRLVCSLGKRVHSPISSEFEVNESIRTLSFCCLAFPPGLKSLASIYEHIHEAFLAWMDRNSPSIADVPYISHVFSSVNYLLGHGLQHSIKFAPAYFPHIINCIRTRHFALFQQTLKFLALVDTWADHSTTIAALLLEELENPIVCPIYSCDPIALCHGYSLFRSGKFETSALNSSDLTRFMFLDLLVRIKTPISPIPLALVLFKLLSEQKVPLDEVEQSIKSDSSKPQLKNSSDWTSIVRFHASHKFISSSLDQTKIAWYKLWFASRSFTSNSNDLDVNVESLDEIARRLISGQSITRLNSFTLEALYCYGRTRFDGLWWTKSAHEFYSLTIDSLLATFSEDASRLDIFSEFEFVFNFIRILFLPFKVSFNPRLYSSRYEEADLLRTMDLVQHILRDSKCKRSAMELFSECPTLPDGCVEMAKLNESSPSNLELYTKRAHDAVMTLMDIAENATLIEKQATRSHSARKLPVELIILVTKFISSLVTIYTSKPNLNTLFQSSFSDLSSKEKVSMLSLYSTFIPPLSIHFSSNIDITELLSNLVPFLQNEAVSDMSRNDLHLKENVFDNFGYVDKSPLEVNPLLINSVHSGCFDYFSFKKEINRCLFAISSSLSSSYSSAISANSSAEFTTIMSDWDAFTTELFSDVSFMRFEHDGSRVVSLDEIRVLLKEKVDCCNLEFSPHSIQRALRSSAPINYLHVFPDASIVKEITISEQWITFLFVAFNVSLDAAFDWLLKITATHDIQAQPYFIEFLQNQFNRNGGIILNCHRLLVRWLKSDRPLDGFPWILLGPEISRKAFILSSSYFLEILSKGNHVQSVEAFELLLNIEKGDCSIRAAHCYLMASLMVAEASDEQGSKAKFIKDLLRRHLSSEELGKSALLPILSAVIDFGQNHPWSLVVKALANTARLFKLSSASDFSELFNPIHSICLLPDLIREKVNCFTYVRQLLGQVPILSHYPALLKLLLSSFISKVRHDPSLIPDVIDFFLICKTRLNSHDLQVSAAFAIDLIQAHFGPKQSDNFRKSLVLQRIFAEQMDEKDVQSSTTAKPVNLISFILAYCHVQLSGGSKTVSACEVIYRLLNSVNISGIFRYSLDDLDLSPTVRADLRMFVLPVGSKVLSFSRVAMNRPFVMDDTLQSLDDLNMLQTVSYTLLTSFDETLQFCINFTNDLSFYFGILPYLFQNSTTPTSNKVIIQLVKVLNGSPDSLIPQRVIEIYLNNCAPGPNIVENLTRKFGQSPQVFNILQAANQCPHISLYCSFLKLESSPQIRQDLDLSAFQARISTLENSADYINVIKERMQKFDVVSPLKTWRNHFGMTQNECKLVDAEPRSDLNWLESNWIEQTDFQATAGLNRSKFELERNSLNWLRNLIQGKDDGPTSTVADDFVVSFIKSAVAAQKERNLKKSSLFSQLVPLFMQSPPKRIHFQLVSLLPVISQKLVDAATFTLAAMTSQLLCFQGKVDEAIEIGKNALKLAADFSSSSTTDEGRALLLSQLGEWIAGNKSARPSLILSEYLDPAMALCESNSSSSHPFSPKSFGKIHLKMARFLDEQYQQINESEDLKLRSKLLEESRAALNAARASNSTKTGENRRQLEMSVATLRSQYDLDMHEFSERMRSRNSFLVKSAQNYLHALLNGLSDNEEMAAMFRVCSLWFSNPDFPALSDLLNNAIGSSTATADKRTMPLRLFLPLIYQLAARASYHKDLTAQNHFQRVLIRLLVQLTVNYPFQCIYQLLALRAGASTDQHPHSKRRKLIADASDSDASTNNDLEAQMRAAAASLVIDQARKIADIAEKVSAVELLCDAYIELAHLPVNSPSAKTPLIEFESTLKVCRLLHPLPSDSPCRLVPIPTTSSSSEVEAEDEVKYFAGFKNGFRLVGGINLPKQIEVFSTAASRHSQLIKGNDDVRQDAVMEQVFHRVNRLFSADPETRRRRLAMRTYRVIPLRPLVGLLEWVSDSTPLAVYLTEAHERLKPGDLHPNQCRELLKQEFERPGSTAQSKLSVLTRDIGSRFAPVLRHFFFEHFSPQSLWSAKQAYLRSMATASIVGWAVGLGDRHGMNILLDKSSGEVIHIDLNMIFEQGRTLRIPEKVPFRLTPDCIDAMGPDRLGLDGPFKQHAIAALKVLRNERALLLMVLEVFKYDPLQKWTGMAKALLHTGLGGSSGGNSNLNTVTSDGLVAKEAHRALLRIKEKLEGREEGVALSEAGHVAFLIQTASDPELLCQMYYGWQAYF